MSASSVVNPALDQRRQALEIANQRRLGGAALRRDVHAGRVDFTDALQDERAQSLALYRLLSAQRGWGNVKVERFCRRVGISPGRRVDELTDRERGRITAALMDGAHLLRGWH